jgi:hypothetical protein
MERLGLGISVDLLSTVRVLRVDEVLRLEELLVLFLNFIPSRYLLGRLSWSNLLLDRRILLLYHRRRGLLFLFFGLDFSNGK